MKKAVIFDLDGTLLNTLASIAHCGNSTLEHFGLKTLEVEKYAQYIGHGADRLLSGIFEWAGGDRAVFEHFRRFYLDLYGKNGSYKVTPYDGIIEMLDQLKTRGVKAAVLTNKPHNVAVEVCKAFFGDRLCAVYGQREGVPIKPDRFMVDKILGELGITADECIFCGDSAVDVKTGQNAGMLMLGAAWGFYGDSQFDGASAVILTPTELLRYI